MPVSPLDFVLLQCGTPGYYQIFIAFLLCCLQLPITFTSELYKQYINEPPHRCQLTPNQIRRFESSLNGLNLHRNEWYPLLERQRPEISLASPLIDELMSLRQNATVQQFDQCNIFVDPLNQWRGVRHCQNGWEFWTPNNENNLITEFSLVCEQKNYLEYLKYTLFFTASLGAILMGLLADRWGRTKTLHFSLYLFVASSLSTFFSSDFLQFSIFYSLQIFFVSSIEICSFVLMIELIATPFQFRASIIWILFRSLTSLLIPLLISIINNWRFIQLSIAIPSLSFFTYIFVLPSSPLWLTVVKHNLADSVRILERFGKFNSKILSINQLNQHIQNLYISSLSFPSTNLPYSLTSDQSIQSSKSSPLTIQNLSQYSRKCKNAKLSRPGPVLRWQMLVFFYLFFVVTVLRSEFLERHSLILHQNSSVNNVYNIFLEIGLLLFVYQLSLWTGSRLLQSFLLTLQGVLILCAVVLREQLKSRAIKNDFNYDQRLLLLPPLMICIARSLCASSVAMVWFMAAKTLPTRIRCAGLGFCYFWLRLGLLTVPQLITWSDRLARHEMLLLFGGLAIIGGMLTLLYPNIDRRPLPNTVEDLLPKPNGDHHNAGNHHNNLYKRYPSYSDLKNLHNSSSSSSSSSGTVQTTPIRRFEPSNVYSFANESVIESSIDKIEIKKLDSTDSKRSTSRKSSSTNITVNETDKSSMSSLFNIEHSSLSSNNQQSTQNVPFTSQSSPSTSTNPFDYQASTSATTKPSITRILSRPSQQQHYADNEQCNVEQEIDVFTIELGAEPLSFDSNSPTARAMVQGFTYTPQKFDSVGPLFTSRH